MQVFLKSNGREVILGPDAFVAQGGEGKVFARDGMAYKLYHDPASMPPADKLAALARLTAPQVVRPQDVLLDGARRPVGYSMRHVDGAHPLCRLFNKSFRKRHGVTARHDAHLAEALRQALAQVHAHGVLVVDLNELNVLVGPGFQAVSLIDVDSWQTPGHPATAILDSVRDRHAAGFDVGTDWFAWAVVTCQLFLGVHPYKGTHPTLKGLDARMLANASVFDPQVKRPPAARPVDAIPGPLRDWYRQVFQHGLRTPPPPVVPGAMPVAAALTDGRALSVQPVWTAPSPIRRAVEHLGTLVAVCADGLWVGGRRVGDTPAGPVAIGFGGRDQRPVVAHVAGGRLHLFDAQRRAAVVTDLAATAVTATRDGRLLALNGANLVEVRLHPVGDTLLAAPRVLARVRPAATELLDGVAVERLPGGAQALMSLAPGQVVPVPLPPGRVVDARADGGVLVVGIHTPRGPQRVVVRLGPGAPDVQVSPGPAHADLVTLDRGVAVLLEADGLRVMPTAPRAPGLRAVPTDQLGDGATLTRLGDRVGAIHGDTVYALTLR